MFTGAHVKLHESLRDAARKTPVECKGMVHAAQDGLDTWCGYWG